MAETLKYFTAVSSFLPGAHYVETQHVPRSTGLETQLI